MAVDPTFVPYGAPLWIDTTDPIVTDAPLRRLVVAQDAGGAIKGQFATICSGDRGRTPAPAPD